MEQRIAAFLLERYGVHTTAVTPVSRGCGGDVYEVASPEGHFLLKIADENEMSHPAEEVALCDYLRGRGIPASRFVRTVSGDGTVPFDGRVSHLQAFVAGEAPRMNTAPPWLMEESPLLLARIHNALRDGPALPEGIGPGFFCTMTMERALLSYIRSEQLARERGDTAVLDELAFRIGFAKRHAGWRFDPEGLTFCGSHGDFTVNQLICADGRIAAVVDWTSACRHPVVWEITRSFFYANPACASGAHDRAGLEAYAARYASVAPLNDRDRECLLSLYIYQLAVCDDYAQYLGAEGAKRAEYLEQARFATGVLRCWEADGGAP